MKITRPEQEDLDAAFDFVGMMKAVAEFDLNPLERDEFDECRFLEDEDKAEVLDALCEKFNNCDLEWLMTVLNTLLSPQNGIVNQESEVLEFHPRFKSAISETQPSK